MKKKKKKYLQSIELFLIYFYSFLPGMPPGMPPMGRGGPPMGPPGMRGPPPGMMRGGPPPRPF